MSPMIVTKKYLPRRTFLRGLGATIALPLLDGMVPAFAAMQNSAAKPIKRLGAIYVPNGMNMLTWTPKAFGSGFELPSTLSPLASVRDQLLVLSGLDNKQGDGLPGEGSGDHSRSQAAFLTGMHAKKTEGADIGAGVSMDQIAAREFGRHTQLSSLELALEQNEVAGTGEDGYSAAYIGTIAWRGEKDPLPMEADPRAVFERLFGASESTDARARMARMQRERSILDAVTEQLSALKRGLGPRDRTKVAEYLDSVRDIERRIQIAELQSERELPTVEQPAGVPESFIEYAKLMFDLNVLAFQCDLTRVSTFLVGREKSSRSFPEIGVVDSHHPVSHHQNRPETLEKKSKIDKLHVSLYAHFLERLKETPDGDGNLLDHSLILYGAGMSESDGHVHHDLPVLLAGGGAGSVKSGRHIQFEGHTPLTNLHLTLLDKMGVPIDNLGDSTGRLGTVLSEI
jgi:hypothetical protein